MDSIKYPLFQLCLKQHKVQLIIVPDSPKLAELNLNTNSGLNLNKIKKIDACPEPEDDLDAFNDDTFGGDADEWKEDDHEQLAQLTEQVPLYTGSAR